MLNFDPRYCRVCGYEPEEPPWGEAGDFGTFDICPCCCVEWGYEDSSEAAAAQYRERWLRDGAVWADRHTPQDGLTVEKRLKRVLG